ncbi:MAG: NAD(P)/FAD-dependent oxidoreductase, partial [Acidimicrobiia bacterium]
MRETADVVVVGAGIIGASIAYNLVRRGAGKVVALDKGAGPAEGSTGASSSIVRCRYTHPEVVRLALDGQHAYREWADFTGLDRPRSSLHQVGVLWMMGESPDQVEVVRDRLAGQGVAVSVLGPEQVAGRFPALSPCSEPFDLTGDIPHTCRSGEAFLLEEKGGYVEPTGANQDVIEAARRDGADVRFGAQVCGVRKAGGR